MRTLRSFPLILASLLSLAACGVSGTPDSSLVTVPELDLTRYKGTWYDVADYPQRFQQDCQCTKAEYVLNPWGDVGVFNSCHVGGPLGPPAGIVGRAFRPNPDEPGKLKVSFFNPRGSDYWVIELGADYDYAVVSSPDMDTLWVLSRTRTMAQDKLDGILGRLETRGFDLSRVEYPQQEGCPPF